MQIRCHSLQQMVYKLSRIVSRKHPFSNLTAHLVIQKMLTSSCYFYCSPPSPNFLGLYQSNAKKWYDRSYPKADFVLSFCVTSYCNELG